ncbi:MAG: outer membrane protein transport protein [Desulfobacterium sp.]|nr:outer membrane protein transport protein [Desulfobacterium sp.]
MKRLLMGMAILVSAFLGAADALANIDNLSNMSVEWMRTGNRNAATDRADAVIYNPGGITELDDGIAVNLGNQSMRRRPSHSFDLGAGAGEKSFEQDGDDLFLPNLYAAYNRDRWALWGGFYIPGGGAVVDYPQGSFTTQLLGTGMLGSTTMVNGTIPATITGFSGDWLDAESIYMTVTLGGTYKLNDWVSVAAGMRYIDAETSIKAGMTAQLNVGGTSVSNPVNVDYEQMAYGAGIIIGADFFPTDKMNIGIQYQSKVELDFEIEVNQDDTGMFMAQNGTETPRDLPAMLGLGLGYDLTDKIYLETNYSYWFQEDADWGEDPSGRDISDMAGDTQSFGLTGTYKWTDFISTSLGAVYTDFLWNDRNGYYMANIGSYEVLYTDNWQVCGGISWQINKKLEVNLALARTIWDDADLVYTHPALGGVTIKTENESTILSFGMNLTF